MKIPIFWLEKYIKLEHSVKEFGDIMTDLEFMQDGPVKVVDGKEVIDVEVRQNRPDMLSILGAAREYAAYIGKKINYPKSIEKLEIEWAAPSDNLSVESKSAVKRFCTVEIRGVKVKKSPDWLQESLLVYGIPPINNIVDITNFVMLEYGIPTHAFDIGKLKRKSGTPLLTLRMAENDETFETWQKTKLKLTKEDLVIADAEKPVGIGGIIGGANSDIDDSTTHILFEAATYDQAAVRRTALRHAIRTEASSRHEKFLNPEMVEKGIRRGLELISEICGGEIVKIEDYYENKSTPIVIDFNIFEIERLGGIQIQKNEAIKILQNLEFEVISDKQALGANKDVITVRVPPHRTDVNSEADLVEEVLRLKGYENIPLIEIKSAPPTFSTPDYINLEDKIRDILVSLGLDEHITNPLMKFDENISNQIILENPLNLEMNALRTKIRQTLFAAVERNIKSGRKEFGLFELGKIYEQKRRGEYIEKRMAETIYNGYEFSKIKANLLAVLKKLGISSWDQKETVEEETLVIEYKSKKVAVLHTDGFELSIDDLVQVVNLDMVPDIKFHTTLVQKIQEDISLVFKKAHNLRDMSVMMKEIGSNIKEVVVSDIYENSQLGVDKISATFKIIFEDIENSLTREKIEKVKQEILTKLKSKFDADLRT